MDDDIIGQTGIEGIGQAIHGDGALHTHAGDVIFGVDTGIGTAAARDRNLLSAGLFNGLFDLLLDGDAVLLALPAMIGGAQIGKF